MLKHQHRAIAKHLNINKEADNQWTSLVKESSVCLFICLSVFHLLVCYQHVFVCDARVTSQDGDNRKHGVLVSVNDSNQKRVKKI
jgi:hypothetical protein